MRKDNMQQKNTTVKQLILFTRTDEPVVGDAGGNSKENDTGVELSSRLEQQRALTEHILERIVDYGNLDRLVQQAIHQELNRYYEPYFSDHSYGFRTGRSAGQAIVQASDYIAEGMEWVVDIDLEKFFDTINHDRLMQRLSKGIGDKRLLRLINAYLKTGIMTGGIQYRA